MISTENLLMFTFVTLFLYAMTWITPHRTRRGIVFGVRVPAAHLDRPEIAGLLREYDRFYGVLGGAVAAGFIAAVWLTRSAPAFFAGLLTQLALVYVAYFRFRGKLLALKESGIFAVERPSGVVVVDTRFRETPLVVSWRWYAAPWLIVAINALLPVACWAGIPARLPFHWNLAGQVDNWVDKSWAMVEAMPLLMAFVTGMMMVFSLVLRAVKQEINPESPGRSVAQNRLFRLRWSKYMLASSVAVDLVFTVVNLNILSLVPMSASVMMLLIFGLLFLTMAYTLVLTARDGQGGSYIPVPDDGQTAGAPRDDDRFYKWGLFYVNADDPALWVEKRYGVGWTLNFGNRRSWLIMGALLAVALGSILLPLLLVRSEVGAAAAEAIQPCAQPVVDNLLEGMKTHDYERAVKDFSPEMLAAMDAAKMRQQAESVFVPKLGVPEAWRYDKAKAKGGFVSLLYRVDFTQEKDVTVRVVFRPKDPEFKVQGLWLDSPKLRQ